eukprot:4450427-Heterocapsa_arctica.AAC.1
MKGKGGGVEAEKQGREREDRPSQSIFRCKGGHSREQGRGKKLGQTDKGEREWFSGVVATAP